MSRPLRVLQVIQNLNYGGMERLLADIVRRLDPARFESHVMALGYLGRFAEGLEACSTLHLAPRLPPWSLLYPGPLVRAIRTIAPDVVHMHSGVWYKVSLAARLAGVPRLVFTEHGRAVPDPWLARFLDALAARRTDVTVAVSQAVHERLAGGIVRDRSRLVVVENGVDTEEYAPAPDNGRIRAELGIPERAPIIGSVGRLEYIKGYDVMIEAFHRLRMGWAADTAPVLVVGGDGSERPRLQARVDELGLGGSVFLLGWRDDIHDLHASFSLFTMSSRSEGTSVSLLEAMSAGLCPVVTDVGGNAEVLGPDLREALVPPEDPEALAMAWERVLAAGNRPSPVPTRQRVVDRFSLKLMVQRYAALYRGVSANKPLP